MSVAAQQRTWAVLSAGTLAGFTVWGFGDFLVGGDPPNPAPFIATLFGSVLLASLLAILLTRKVSSSIVIPPLAGIATSALILLGILGTHTAMKALHHRREVQYGQIAAQRMYGLGFPKLKGTVPDPVWSSDVYFADFHSPAAHFDVAQVTNQFAGWEHRSTKEGSYFAKPAAGGDVLLALVKKTGENYRISYRKVPPAKLLYEALGRLSDALDRGDTQAVSDLIAAGSEDQLTSPLIENLRNKEFPQRSSSLSIREEGSFGDPDHPLFLLTWNGGRAAFAVMEWDGVLWRVRHLAGSASSKLDLVRRDLSSAVHEAHLDHVGQVSRVDHQP